MIRLSNGHCFEYMTASGALGYDGKGWPWEWPLRWIGLLDHSLFTVVIKTLTREPKKGNFRWYNPFGCIRIIDGGVVNAVGFTNPGIEWWCRKVGPTVDSRKIPLVGSIFSEEPEELVEMAIMLNPFDLVALEINASCPNAGRGFLENTEKVITGCKVVRTASRFPLIVKLSVVHDVDFIIPRIEGVVEAITINSVPWRVIFPQKKSPLAHLGGGGVSGKIAQPFTWKMVEKLVSITEIPVIGPSVWEFQDIEELRKIGAKAVSFGSLFLARPQCPTLFVRRDKKGHLEKRG